MSTVRAAVHGACGAASQVQQRSTEGGWDTTTLPPPSEVRGAWWAERVIPEAHTPGTSVLGREAPEDLASVGTAIFGPTRMHVCVRRAAGHLSGGSAAAEVSYRVIIGSGRPHPSRSVTRPVPRDARGRQDTLLWAVPSYPFSHWPLSRHHRAGVHRRRPQGQGSPLWPPSGQRHGRWCRFAHPPVREPRSRPIFFTQM